VLTEDVALDLVGAAGDGDGGATTAGASERAMGAVVHRQPDHVDVLLAGGLGDHGRSLAQSGVDHLDAGVAQDAGDDLGAAIVPVEPDLGDQDAKRLAVGAHTWGRSTQVPNTLSSAPMASPTVT
jgi:hypothetical protein